MRFYFYKTPILLKKIYKPCVWSKPTKDPVIYLTFDDGPVPGATSYVLQTLDRFKAKATFFVVGDNVEKYPAVFNQVITAGHSIGNHTFNHLKGWNTDYSRYLENVAQCQDVILKAGYERSSKPLFRPPYGRITTQQLHAVSLKYDVIMWEILSGDFDRKLNHQSSWSALQKSKPGDIVVFHDSNKYLDNVKSLLPGFLQHYTDLGYRFESL